MKKYKATYCISLFTYIIYFSITFIISGLPLCFVLSTLIEPNATELFFMLLLGELMLILLCVIFVLLMNLIIKTFTKNVVYLSNIDICYKGKSLELSQIKYATVYLPEISKTSSEPLQLVLWIDDSNSIIIKRPSISLILRIKKICQNSKFSINEPFKDIKLFSIIGAIVGVILSLILLFNK